MLTSLRLRNFKSFADAHAPFGPLTLLVGANASGKSNVLDALRLLRGLGAEGLPLEQVLAGTAGWTGIRGGIHEAVRTGADAFVLESSWRVDPEQPDQPVRLFEHLIEGVVTPSPMIRHERLLESGVALFETDVDAKDGTGAATGSLVPGGRIMIEANSSVLAFLAVELLVQSGESARRLVQEYLEGIRFLDVVPSAMRGYVPQKRRELGENGENLSAILWQLCQEPDQKRELVDWLSELCSPELADIEFSLTDEGDVMLRLVETDGGKVSARSLSDGTLRFLGELVALRTAPKGSLILLEELGRELHPSRVHLLVEYLESITEERGIQVIATTHSPLVLEALGPKARGDVVALGHVPDQPGTVMKRVSDLPRFEEVVERRGMAYLFTTNWLEQAL
ncbi:ATP-binding protein [Archangium sp.]|uniref:AAA family ATPase n=1 Tax=Archangium sp. TaxID=1872627 RepID=UPI00286C74C6|nr:ATP-binding protein [Archangium sp.]